METPRSDHHSSDTATTPDTQLPKVFDSDDSSLSSAASLSSDFLDDSPIKAAQTPPQATETETHTQSVAKWVNESLWGEYTAASQRKQRGRKKPELFPGISQPSAEDFEEESDTHDTNEPAITTNAQDVELPSAPEKDEVQPKQQTAKRKRQTSSSDVTEQPPKKKVKANPPSKRSGPSESDRKAKVEDAPPAPAPVPTPARQTRKRKSTSLAPAEAKTPPAKKTRIAAPQPGTPTKPKSKARTPASKTPVRKSGRVTRLPEKLRDLIEEQSETVQVRRSSILKLKMFDGWQGERTRSNSSASNADATSTRNNAAPSRERPSSESPATQSTYHTQEQYAQQAWTPIPASSQLSSNDESQVVEPTSQFQTSDRFDPGLQAPQHPSIQASQSEVALPPNPFTSDAIVQSQPVQQQSSQPHEDVTMAGTDLHGSFSTLSFQSTQPTLILEEQWDPIAAKTAHVQSRTAQLDPDAVSDATTEDEGDMTMPQPRPLLPEQQQKLYDITKQLFASRSPGATKPAPAGQPEVWADGRQELCETLHYYRAYQSACYSTGGFVRAFMFDKVAHARDYVDSDVIISRAGGGLIKDQNSGEMKSNKDQKDKDPIVDGLYSCMRHFNPLVIITGMDNPHIPSQPPHQYCVLDYFKPTHIWCEKSGNNSIRRYRFEKLNVPKESWWRPENEKPVVDLGALEPPVEQICRSCKEKSTQIYLNGWMCLQTKCNMFWRIIDDVALGSHTVSHEPDETSLIYDPRFLKQKTPWPNDDSDLPLAFNAPEISAHAIAGENTSQAFWSGMVCPDCGKCNSRLGWTGWECSPACGFKKEPPHSLIPAVALRDPFWPLTDSYTMSRDWHSDLISVSVSFAHGYRINKYTIPGLDGFITHMIANKTVLEEAGGPDDMFEQLQQTEIGLRRRAMPNGQLKGESYCRHFTVNYGMPYKFIAATASHSFEGAAKPITDTRSRLNWAAKHLLGSEHRTEHEFNEVLALGYFESQKINYHDDGEFGLGPTIATLSLGAPGSMKIRMKARHFHGCSSANVYDASRPLPGCQKYEERLALHDDLQALKQSDAKAYRARLKQIPKEICLRSNGNAKDVLTMQLGHGDVVVMHGAEVQKYYEHAVEHSGKLRFALTCRYIDPESLGDGDKPQYEVGRDEGGYDGSKVC